jgi:hypothetical protein
MTLSSDSGNVRMRFPVAWNTALVTASRHARTGVPRDRFRRPNRRCVPAGRSQIALSVGAAQGVNADKDQVGLRREFCEKYAAVTCRW